jgi:hypothetical protein
MAYGPRSCLSTNSTSGSQVLMRFDRSCLNRHQAVSPASRFITHWRGNRPSRRPSHRRALRRRIQRTVPLGCASDAAKVTVTSIFPGCYAGRWPHIHFEVYKSLSAATKCCPRPRVISCTRRLATKRACAISRASPWQPTACSAAHCRRVIQCAAGMITSYSS